MAYLGKTPSQAVRSRYYFTASGSETSLSPSEVSGLSFTDANYVDVSLNGVALVSGTDYTATPSTNTISGLAALAASDVVEIVVYDTFSVFGGSVKGNFDIDGGNLTLGDNDKILIGDGSDLQISHDGSGSLILDNGTGNLVIAADELIIRNAGNNEAKADFTTNGAVNLYYDNAAKLATKSDGVDITGELQADSLDIDGAADISGTLSVAGKIEHTGDTDTFINFLTNEMRFNIGGTANLNLTSTGLSVNEDSVDMDFRVESNGNANMLVVDGGNNSVGIGLAAGSQEAGAFLHSGGQCLFQHNHTDTSSSGNVSYLAGNQALTLVNAQGGAVDQTCKLGFTITTTGANSDALVECKSTAAGTTEFLFYVESSNALGEACRIVNQNGGDLNFGGMSTFSFANTETQVNKFQINSGRNTTSARTHAAFGNPNGQVGSITTNGSATAYNTSSDHRLKENVADMTGAITRVKTLAPKRFNFIADDSVTVDGFLAHEAQAVVPEAVTGTHNEVETWTQQEIDDGDAPDGTSAGDNKLDGDGNTIPVMQAIDQSKLVPLLTAALKEAITKIETLETQRADLEARVTALENAE